MHTITLLFALLSYSALSAGFVHGVLFIRRGSTVEPFSYRAGKFQFGVMGSKGYLKGDFWTQKETLFGGQLSGAFLNSEEHFGFCQMGGLREVNGFGSRMYYGSLGAAYRHCRKLWSEGVHAFLNHNFTLGKTQCIVGAELRKASGPLAFTLAANGYVGVPWVSDSMDVNTFFSGASEQESQPYQGITALGSTYNKIVVARVVEACGRLWFPQCPYVALNYKLAYHGSKLLLTSGAGPSRSPCLNTLALRLTLTPAVSVDLSASGQGLKLTGQGRLALRFTYRPHLSWRAQFSPKKVASISRGRLDFVELRPTMLYSLSDARDVNALLKTEVITQANGLPNPGFYCFRNAVVQAVTYCPSMLRYAAEHRHTKQCSILEECGFCLFEKHINEQILQQRHTWPELSKQLEKLLIDKKIDATSDQQCADEFFNFFLEWLRDYEKPLQGVESRPLVNQLFGIEIVHIHADHPKNKRRHEIIRDFKIAIQENGDSVEAALDRFFEEELGLCIHRLPHVVSLFFNRVSADDQGELIKNTKPITIPEVVDFSAYLDKSVIMGQRYRPCALIEHLGSRPSSGHYVATFRASDGYWYRLDDDSAPQRLEQWPSEVENNVCLLFLEREDK